MKNIYFLDTSYILALEIRNEDAHKKVLQNWAALASSKPFLVTTTYVFDEVVTFFNSRNFHYNASDQTELSTRTFMLFVAVACSYNLHRSQ